MSIPVALKKTLELDPLMKLCALQSPECQGRIEWHHVFIYQGRQIQEPWSILGACADFHHRGTGFDKERFEYIALNRASRLLPFIIKKYPRVDWLQKFNYLSKKYEKYRQTKISNPASKS